MQGERRGGEQSGQGAHVLLTGATGFLGKVVLHELLRRRDELGVGRVHAVVRGKRRGAPADRFRQEVIASPCFAGAPADWWDAVAVVPGELSRPDAGLAADARRDLTGRITHVIHCAASVDFDLPLPQAAIANVDGALHVLELAQTCPRLVSMVDVSTAYVTPHPGDGVSIPEALARLPRLAADLHAEIRAGAHDAPEAQARLLAETGHPNTYTLTKCLAEHRLVERGGVPLTLVRPSIISAALHQPFPDWIDSAAGFSLFIIAVATRRMRVLMAKPGARVDLIPVDAVADREIGAAFAPAPAPNAPRIVHAVAGYERSPSVGVCARRVSRYFARHPIGEGPTAGLRYVGPSGPVYRLQHRVQHGMRRLSRPVAERLDEMNRVFAYFTHHSFRFESSVPFAPPGFRPERYVDGVSRGIHRHLLAAAEAGAPSGAAPRASDPERDAVSSARARAPEAERSAGARPWLVTGASGFVGRHLLEACAQRQSPRCLALVRDPERWSREPWTRGLDVDLVRGSVTDAAAWSAGLPRLGGIAHLAAVVRHSRRDPGDRMHETNVEGTLAMVRLAAAHACRLLVVSSSGTVGCFRDADRHADETSPVCEDEVAGWPYYASKIELERRARALADELGVELVLVRPPILLGPGDHRFRSTSNVVRFLRRKLPFLVRGGIHFADVRDAAAAIAEALARPDVRPVYHLPGTECGIEEFFAMLSEVSGEPVPRFVLPFRPAWLLTRAVARLHLLPDPVVIEMAAHHWGAHSLFAAELGYKSREPRETLRDTVEWLRANHEELQAAAGRAQ